MPTKPPPQTPATPSASRQRAPTQKPSTPLARGALIAANAIPLLGVLFAGWDTRSVLFIYWAESAIVGVYALLRLVLVVGGGGAWLLAPFFCFHYGMFMFVHLVFLNLMTRPNPMSLRGSAFPTVSTVTDALGSGGVLALGVFALSHGISHLTNVRGREEYKGMVATQAITAPYKRIVLMHLAIVLGGALAMALGSAMPLLVLLVIGKTALDLRAHLAEHTPPPAGEPSAAAN